MRAQKVTVAGVGQALAPLNQNQTIYQLSYTASCTQAGSGAITGRVDSTISDLGAIIPCTYSQALFAITITFPTTAPHTLGSSADYMLISGTGIAGVDGLWPVASVTNDTVIVVTSGTSQTKTGSCIATPIRFYSTTLPSTTLPLFGAVPTQTLASRVYDIPFTALILRVTVNAGSGVSILECRQAGTGQI